MPYSLVSVPKKNPNQGRPTPKKFYVILFRWEDVASYERDDKGVNVTTFAMKEGKTPIAVYASNKSIHPYHETSGDDGSKGFLHHVDFESPGNELEMDELVENIVNEELGAITVACGTGKCRIAGTPCSPLVLSDTTQDNAEASKHTIQLVSQMIGPALGHIAKNLIPVTDNADLNIYLELTVPADPGV